MATVIKLPTDYYPDPQKGRPVFQGWVYIGVADKDPELFPKDIFAIQEDGTQVPLTNPFRTSSGGIPVDESGNIIKVTTIGNYSLRVLRDNGNSPGSLAYEFPNAANLASSGASIAEQIELQSGQLEVTFSTINTTDSAFFICGDNADSGRLCDTEFELISDATIKLAQSYPAGTFINAVQGEKDGVVPLVATIEERVVLSAAQSTVVFSQVNVFASAFYACGSPMGGRLCEGINYTVTDSTTIELIDSYPDGQVLMAVQNDQVSTGSVITVFGRSGIVSAQQGDYDSDQIDNASTVSGSSVTDALDNIGTSVSELSRLSVKQVTSPYTLQSSDTNHLLHFTDPSDATLNIPDGLTLGTNVLLLNDGGGNVLLTTTGTDTVRGALTLGDVNGYLALFKYTDTGWQSSERA